MMTKKLYLESIEAAYLEEFTAEVIAIEDNKIVLDQTLFYPLGGGQNWDLGTIDGPNGENTLDFDGANDDKELIFCSKQGCAEVAYFWCNRNRCTREYCKSHNSSFKNAGWQGCGEPVCCGLSCAL